MLRIAFIMLCHKNAELINLLIKKLSEFTNSDIYIHVDLKHSEIRERLIKQKNVYLLPLDSSYRIDWGNITVVKATLQLIRTVKNSGKQYEYIWLISGQDYPICPIKEIEKRLLEKQGLNYIETILPGNRRYNWYKKLYEVAYPSWINIDNFAVKVIKRMVKILTGGTHHTFSFFIRKRPFLFELAFGSQWWTLTSEAAYDILDYSDAHPEILNYYRNSIIPDECFFQTMFIRGPYANCRAMNLSYVKWGKDHRHPQVLIKENVELLREKSDQFYFARKFDLPTSIELINLINE